uniref:Protein Abitram n=1 Tax=Megaselia scalaris TaxID=36166 RepID=T1GY62_MEGSC
MLAPEHEALRVGVKSITFDIGNTNRSQNQVKGKGKKGGMILQQDSAIAIITDNNDVTYKVPSCIQGKLIEVNERLLKDVSLLGKEGDGYIAVVLPKPEQCEDIKASLMTEDQYLASLNKL